KNQCVHYEAGGAKKADIVFFPTLNPSQENSGCCVSDLIKKSKGIANKQNGIKTSQETCNSLFGTWTAGGNCSEPLSPSQAVKLITSSSIGSPCGCKADQKWCK
ncbi:hypothetical protein GWN26_02280, partial [Candidatus Saccharibacteria bacterium]|nr:hypothetical protein [Candidatus Saccharibacteria bacterium]NIW78329.1 hypothetical protein [Calditrichia bacterium]